MQPTWLWLILFVAVCPALGEEWLCRGVLWRAMRSVIGPNGAVLGTAIPFAFMHSWNGGWVLELPHRFVMGLLLGWLRERTGSIWPCVVAHFLHNAIAVSISP